MASISFAGVSVIGEVRLPQPASAATAVTCSGYHLLVVNGYSSLVKDIPNGEFRESRHFEVGGYPWTLRCYPNGKDPDQDGYMSFYLFLDQGNVFVPVMVQYGFSFVDRVLQNKNYPPLLDGANETLKFFSRHPYSFSAPCLTKREKFEKSKYLKNDSFTIKCDIVITKYVNINEATAGTVPVSNVLPSPEIRQDLGDLLRSGTGADVTFQVGRGTFRAHRCVLAARSSVFRAQLFGPLKEGITTNVIHVKDMEEQVFKLLLDFIYSDSVPEVDDTEEDEIMWQHHLEAADRYDLPRLTLMCEQELCKYINTTTVASILALAAQHHCRGLKEACLDFLNSLANLKRVVALDALEPLVSSCPSVLKDLIGKLASLKIDTGNTGAVALPPVIDVPESDMHLHFSSLLHSEERTDVTFQVGGETFHAHRCVLAARSAVFRAELLGPMKDTASNVIRIDNMEARVFKLLLTFIYSDMVPVPRMKRGQGEKNEDDADVMWQQLLVAADRYGIQRLRLMCEMRLGRYINTNTVSTILSVAEQHHCRRLKEECLEFLDCPTHLKQVMAIGGLDHLRSFCPSVLIDLMAKRASL